jgi:hypothetical protein
MHDAGYMILHIGDKKTGVMECWSSGVMSSRLTHFGMF